MKLLKKHVVTFAAATILGAPALFAQSTWISTSSALWSTAGNWSAGLPSTGPQLAIYADGTTVQHTLDLAGTARVSLGMQFNLFSGGSSFNLNSTASPGPGIILRSGGVNGIINNDDSTQNINVPVKLTDSTGISGRGAAVTFNAAAGNLVFNGTNQTSATWTINLNGASNLTFTAAAGKTITVGTTGGGQIVNTNIGTPGGLIKNGAGTLTLGGTLANTFVGTNTINLGSIVAAKANALGANNALVLAGGTFNGGGLGQTNGYLKVTASSTLDLGAGATSMSFSNSIAQIWTGSLLVTGYTPGQDLLRFGTDGTGLTAAQLLDFDFVDFGDADGQIDSQGFVTPVPAPEPSTIALGLVGGLSLMIGLRRNRK